MPHSCWALRTPTDAPTHHATSRRRCELNQTDRQTSKQSISKHRRTATVRLISEASRSLISSLHWFVESLALSSPSIDILITVGLYRILCVHSSLLQYVFSGDRLSIEETVGSIAMQNTVIYSAWIQTAGLIKVCVNKTAHCMDFVLFSVGSARKTLRLKTVQNTLKLT